MSIAFRIDGSTAMKMISSTSSTSIIGVTLMLVRQSPSPPPASAIAIIALLPAARLGAPGAVLGVTGDGRHRARLLVADHAPRTRTPFFVAMSSASSTLA